MTKTVLEVEHPEGSRVILSSIGYALEGRDYFGAAKTQVIKPAAPQAVNIPAKRYPDDGNGDEDAENRGWNACIEAMCIEALRQTPDAVSVPRELLVDVVECLECGIMPPASRLRALLAQRGEVSE